MYICKTFQMNLNLYEDNIAKGTRVVLSFSIHL